MLVIIIFYSQTINIIAQSEISEVKQQTSQGFLWL